mmetsp:Transcript_105268/g.235017  ORF Transcript_105268/g.235017 Transcript_105268/m.235017 type:complete len:166 (-) Transcript_105268:212-709(-)
MLLASVLHRPSLSQTEEPFGAAASSARLSPSSQSYRAKLLGRVLVLLTFLPLLGIGIDELGTAVEVSYHGQGGCGAVELKVAVILEDVLVMVVDGLGGVEVAPNASLTFSLGCMMWRRNCFRSLVLLIEIVAVSPGSSVALFKRHREEPKEPVERKPGSWTLGTA